MNTFGEVVKYCLSMNIIQEIKGFVSYLIEIGKSWFTIVFFALDCIGFIGIYLLPPTAWIESLVSIFTIFIISSLLFSAYRLHQKNIGDKEVDAFVVNYLAVQRGFRVLEVFNASSFDIGDIKIKIKWKQSEEEFERQVESEVVEPNSKLVTTSTFPLSVLESKKKIWVMHIPHLDEGSVLNVNIFGKNLERNLIITFQKDIIIPKIT